MLGQAMLRIILAATLLPVVSSVVIPEDKANDKITIFDVLNGQNQGRLRIVGPNPLDKWRRSISLLSKQLKFGPMEDNRLFKYMLANAIAEARQDEVRVEEPERTKLAFAERPILRAG